VRAQDRQRKALTDALSGQFGHADQLGVKAVAALERRHPGGRAGEYQVAGFQFEQPRQRGEDVRHVVDHLAQARLLAQLVVDVQAQHGIRVDARLRRRAQRGDRRGMVECLGYVPRMTFRLGLRLQVAPGQVQPHAVAPHQRGCGSRFKLAPARAQRHHHLHFVVQVGGRRGVGHVGTVGNHRIGRLAEEHRRGLVHRGTHFARMLGVVAADAEHPADRKALVAADDRQAGDGGCGKDVVHVGKRSKAGRRNGGGTAAGPLRQCCRVSIPPDLVRQCLMAPVSARWQVTAVTNDD
jgi:hypothetical protein